MWGGETTKVYILVCVRGWISRSPWFQEMHEQMSGYKRMRREHQAALVKLEERCKADVDAHKAQLDREYEALLQQLSRDLERLQVTYWLMLQTSRKLNIL